MTRHPVESSNLKSVGYDADTQTLEVEFGSGKVFRYAAVPAEIHAAMMDADSVGGYFAQNVRNNYEAAPAEE